jgi:hypothetical protein
MSTARFRLHAGEGRITREPTDHGDDARPGDTDATSDPLALDPLSPIPFPSRPEESPDPLALDPLSPLGQDAG